MEATLPSHAPSAARDENETGGVMLDLLLQLLLLDDNTFNLAAAAALGYIFLNQACRRTSAVFGLAAAFTFSRVASKSRAS